jgi:hypothetical protein
MKSGFKYVNKKRNFPTTKKMHSSLSHSLKDKFEVGNDKGDGTSQGVYVF